MNHPLFKIQYMKHNGIMFGLSFQKYFMFDNKLCVLSSMLRLIIAICKMYYMSIQSDNGR